MTIEDILRKRIEDRGISIAETARRSSMNAELLRRSLNGMRPIKSTELVRLCNVLELSFDDFEVGNKS